MSEALYTTCKSTANVSQYTLNDDYNSDYNNGHEKFLKCVSKYFFFTEGH